MWRLCVSSLISFSPPQWHMDQPIKVERDSKESMYALAASVIGTVATLARWHMHCKI